MGLVGMPEKALRDGFSLLIDTAVVGMESLEQLRQNTAVAESFRPLLDEERLDLFKEVMPMVTPSIMAWKADDWEKPLALSRR